jgi:hypothetical protein
MELERSQRKEKKKRKERQKIRLTKIEQQPLTLALERQD